MVAASPVHLLVNHALLDHMHGGRTVRAYTSYTRQVNSRRALLHIVRILL